MIQIMILRFYNNKNNTYNNNYNEEILIPKPVQPEDYSQNRQIRLK